MLRTNIFISYSHQDEIWKDRLLDQFSEIKQDSIEVWEDRRIQAGSQWETEIITAINQAAIAILLVSENFLYSDFIREREIPLLLTRQIKEGLRIVPILLEGCKWEELKWLVPFQFRPLDGKPLASFSPKQQGILLEKMVAEITNLRVEHLEKFREKLLQYLYSVKHNAEQLPQYFPRDTQLATIRSRVRVSRTGVMDSRLTAEYREKILQDPPSDASLYRYRMDAHGMRLVYENRTADRQESRIYQWDTEIRPRLKRGVIVGDPGFGKTWLLRWETVKLASEAIIAIEAQKDLSELVFPIPIRLFDLYSVLQEAGEEKEKLLTHAACRLIQRMSLISLSGEPMGKPGPELLAFFRKNMGGENMVLLLDALDEVPTGKKREGLREALNQWIQHSHDPRVIITSRHANYEPPWDNIQQTPEEREMELLPFNDNQINQFIKAWFGQRVQTALQMEILVRNSPQLRGLAELPLLLSFLCALFDLEKQDGSRSPLGEKTIDIASRSEIYNAIIGSLLLRIWDKPHPEKKGRNWQEEQSVLRNRKLLLQEVAFHFFLRDRVQFAQSELETVLSNILKKEMPISGRYQNTPAGIIEELSQVRGILIQGGSLQDFNLQYLFLHLTVQEYLCAAFLARFVNQAGWQKACLPDTAIRIKDLLDAKSWDPRWEQVLILLSSLLEEPGPLLTHLSQTGSDDFLFHRTALAAHCLGEAWLRFAHPEEANQSKLYRELIAQRDLLSNDIYNQWYFHLENGSRALIPHLRSAVPVLIRMQARLNKTTFLEALINLIKNKRKYSLVNEAADLLVKAKNELIQERSFIEGLFEVLQDNTNQAIENKLMDVLEEMAGSLFETDYFPGLLLRFLEKVPIESFVRIIHFFVLYLNYSKQHLSEFDVIKSQLVTAPTAQVRLRIMDLLRKCKGTFIYYAIPYKMAKKDLAEIHHLLENLELDIQDLLVPSCLNSTIIEPADEKAIEWIELAVSMQEQFDNIDQNEMMNILENSEVDGKKIIEILLNDDEIKLLLSNEEVRPYLFKMFIAIMGQGGFYSLIQAMQDPESRLQYIPEILGTLAILLKNNIPEIRIKALEAILNIVEELEQCTIDEQQEETIENSKSEILEKVQELMVTEKNQKVLEDMISVFQKLTDTPEAVQKKILEMKKLIDNLPEEDLISFLEDFFLRSGVPLAKNKVFIKAYINSFAELNPTSIVSNEDLQLKTMSNPALFDVFFEIYYGHSSKQEKAGVIIALGHQKEGNPRFEEGLACIEEGFYSEDSELRKASFIAVKQAGKAILKSQRIIQFLLNGLHQSKDENLAQESAKALRVLVELDASTFQEYESTIFQIAQTLLKTYLDTKSKDVRYSAALTLFGLCKTRFRIFRKEMPGKYSGWFKKIWNRPSENYNIRTLKSLAEISGSEELYEEAN